MAKDPAINWYFDNWSGGTKGFNRFQKGCYMDLLESQFYLGHLSLEQVKNILGSDFLQWNFLKQKFEQDEQGNFFNERLELEKNKRAKYSESRSKNRTKKHSSIISNSHEEDIKNIPEIGIETKTVFEDFEKEMQEKKLLVPHETEKDFSHPDVRGDEINFRNFSSLFKIKWAEWKKSRWINHQRIYKGWNAEQAAIDMMKDYTEEEAIASLQRAISGEWEHVNPNKQMPVRKPIDQKKKVLHDLN